MPANREPLPAVTAAAVVAIIFSLFGILFSLVASFGILIMPDMQSAPGAPVMPPGTRAMTAAIMLFMLALAVFGIFVGAGVIRRRNWARITMLIWGGLMTFFCLSAIAFSFVLFGAMSTQFSTANRLDPRSFMTFMKIFLFVFYGLPAGVGVWWLILFTRPRVAAAFTNPPPLAPVLDASGFPQPADTLVASPKLPSCPLPLAILAGLFILSAAGTLIFVAFPSPYNFPFYFFGHISSGMEPKIVFAAIALILGVSGIGILKLKPWALHTVLAVQGVFFINGLFSVISPTFQTDMQEAMTKMSSQSDAFPNGNPFLSASYIRSAMILGLVFGVVVIGLLVFFRSRFLEQAAAAAAKA